MNAPGAPTPSTRQFALAWLMHPVSVIALAVMVLNDHVLKAQVGSWWTGKLSDVAGLIFFPALVALAASLVSPRMQAPRLIAVAAAVTGVGFAVVKATDAGAAFASATLSAIAGPSRVLADATDLAALAALAVAVLVARACARARWDFASARRRALATVVVPGAILASVATSSGGDDVAVGLHTSDQGELLLAIGNTSWCSATDLDQFECLYWYAQSDDGWWTQTESPGLPGSQVTAEPSARACRAAVPDECFRALPGGIGVQRTTDGGTTWATEWSLTPEQRDYLARKAPVIVFSEGEKDAYAVTRAVAIREVPDGYEVWAANGIDGLTMRDAAGTWHRLGWTTVGDPAYAPSQPHPLSDSEGGGNRDGFPLALAWLGPLASAAAWVVLNTGRRQPSVRWRVGLGLGLGVAVAALGVAFGVSLFARDDNMYAIITAAALLVWAAVISACLVGCAAIAGSANSRTWGSAIGLYTVAFGVAGIASGLTLLVTSSPLAQVLVTVVPVAAIAARWQRTVSRRLQLEDQLNAQDAPIFPSLPAPAPPAPPAPQPQSPTTW